MQDGDSFLDSTLGRLIGLVVYARGKRELYDSVTVRIRKDSEGSLIDKVTNSELTATPLLLPPNEGGFSVCVEYQVVGLIQTTNDAIESSRWR